MSEISEIFNAAIRVINSEFYQRNFNSIKCGNPVTVPDTTENYGGIFTTGNVIQMGRLSETPNHRVTSLSYIHRNPNNVPASKLLSSNFFSSILKYTSLFDGPNVVFTSDATLHHSLREVQYNIREKDAFGIQICRDRFYEGPDNPYGDIHPIGSLARASLSYLSRVQVLVLCDFSFVYELCLIWDYPISSIFERIKRSVEDYLIDISATVRRKSSAGGRHKDKIEFDRAEYFRTMTTIRIPFPGIIVSNVAFPITRTDFIRRNLMTDSMFQWTARCNESYASQTPFSELLHKIPEGLNTGDYS